MCIFSSTFEILLIIINLFNYAVSSCSEISYAFRMSSIISASDKIIYISQPHLCDITIYLVYLTQPDIQQLDCTYLPDCMVS
jgi:hypothetical protein